MHLTPNLSRPTSLTSVVCKNNETILKKAALSLVLNFPTGNKRTWLPLSSLDPNKSPFCWSNGYLMAWGRECSWNFATTFDSVNHRLLLTNLKYNGIGNWVESFLNWFVFHTSVNDPLSQIAGDVSGAPQGPLLGPILFLIYANDLIDNLTIDHLLYADNI